MILHFNMIKNNKHYFLVFSAEKFSEIVVVILPVVIIVKLLNILSQILLKIKFNCASVFIINYLLYDIYIHV